MKKQLVIVLIRVSGKAQDWERQRRKVQKILRFFNKLEVLEEIALKVTGTMVEKTAEYRHAQTLLRRRDVVGMVVPSIDRWFRYKLVSELGRYCEPFEELMDDGKKTAKLIYCTLNEKVVALDLRKTEDQDILIDGARYASKEREVINARLTDGKDIGREDPECKIDDLPDGVIFTPYAKQTADSDGYMPTLVKGAFAYTDFAHNSVKPLFYRFRAGEKLYGLAKELGFGTLTHARNALRNLWWLGYKHRTKTVTKKEWSFEKNDFRHQDIKDIGDIKDCDKTRFVVATNLAETPLIPQDVFDAVQARLAVRKAEYDRREKRADEFLADPLFHCAKCGAKMYSRVGGQGRVDLYYCATRFRKGKTACDERTYSRQKLDDVVLLKAYEYLNDEQFLEDKATECMNDDHRAAAKEKVAAKERFIAEIEKRRRRTLAAIEEEDDPDLSKRLKVLNVELANAKADLQTAQDEVSDIPKIDVKAMKAAVRADMQNFLKKTMIEQKALLAKYVRNITAEVHPVTDNFKPYFKFTITAPVVDVNEEYEPRTPTTPVPLTGPGRVHHDGGGTIGGVPATRRRTKSESRCSASSTP